MPSYHKLREIISTVYRNPWLTFLRKYRKTQSNKSVGIIETSKNASRLWRKMSDREKSLYTKLSHQMPRMHKKHKNRNKYKKTENIRNNKCQSLDRPKNNVKQKDKNERQDSDTVVNFVSKFRNYENLHDYI